MIDDDAQFLELFRGEANERLDSMVDTLLALESGRAGIEVLDSLFRDAHTIKGGAGMLGLADVRTLAHAVEDVLEGVRSTGEFPPALADPLLRAADALRSQVGGDTEGRPDLLEELAARRVEVVGREISVEEPAKDLPAARTAPTERRAIRIAPQKIDRLLDLVGESVLHRRRLEHLLGERGEAIGDELDLGGRLFDELKDAAVEMRTLPISTITAALPRAVRDIAAAEGKDVELVVSGDDTELDRVILESLSEPIIHVIRNAVGHGIEKPEERVRAGKPARGTIELHAEQRGGLVEIVVADDGRGVSEDLLAQAATEGSLADVLARAGVSTADEVTELSGRGVGMDAVKRHVESFGGTLEVRSEPGRGTEIVLTLPLALALLDILLVERGGRPFGIPLASVEEAVPVEEELVLAGNGALELRGRSVPLADLADLIGADAPPTAEGAPAIVVSSASRRVAAACDRLLGQEEVVVKPLGPLLASARGYLGAAVLGDGRVALLLDPASLARVRGRPPARRAAPEAAARLRQAPKVLVVEDSYTVRELQRSILEASGYRVEVARDGAEALRMIGTDDDIDLVITDLEMPELDGIELTRAVRAGARPSLPVVIVTSRGDEEDRSRGLEAGADAYMVKSGFDQQALLDAVARLVGR